MYWEAFFIKSGVTTFTQADGYDTDMRAAKPHTKGIDVATGVAKFYCRRDTGDVKKTMASSRSLVGGEHLPRLHGQNFSTRDM